MSRAAEYVLALVGIFACIFAVLFLGGLASAAWEIRQEKRAGKPVTRPAWDARDKRAALGGPLGVVRVWWASRSHALPTCWCGRGALTYFPALDGSSGVAAVEGIGCAAWEAGDVVAIGLHDDAGGYSRTPSNGPRWDAA